MILQRMALVACIASSICCNSATEPSEQEDLRLTAQISVTPVQGGQIATITVRLENVGSETVNLTFNSGCQILPFILDRSTNRIVYPAGGNWACTAMLTQLSLRPGGVEVREVRVRATSTPGQAEVALTPGNYDAFARLDDIRFRLESAPVLFVIQ
jgi:hypothetical protein